MAEAFVREGAQVAIICCLSYPEFAAARHVDRPLSKPWRRRAECTKVSSTVNVQQQWKGQYGMAELERF